MADISTEYLGLKLRNPLIVGSSGLTDSPDKVAALEQAGAGAVVLKSIFEEEIVLAHQHVLREALERGANLEAVDYLDQHIRGEHLDEYSALVAESKRRVSIPVIASVNCTYSHEWVYFAHVLESAGADALELNMFFLPSDLTRTAQELEEVYFELIAKVRAQVNIPIALKISPYFTDLGRMIVRLSDSGIAGLVLFNRTWSPDFDIERLRLTSGAVMSTPAEAALPLRWIALMSGRVACDLVASTGVHDAAGVIKQVLAGAKAVQVVSTVIRHGRGQLQVMLDGLEDWMTTHGYFGLEQFRGQMAQSASSDPAAYERVQFMKYFGGPAVEGKSGPSVALDGFTPPASGG